MRFTRTIAAALAAAALSLTAGGALAQSKRAPKSWTSVRIATEGAYAPWNFAAAGGKLDGYEVDLAAELCKRMKVTCEVVQQDWDGIIPALNAGKYDAIMAGMNVTDKRREVIDFSRIYGAESAGFGAAKDGPLGKLPDEGVRLNLATGEADALKVIDAMKPMLKGKSVGVQVSTTNANLLEKYFKGVIDIREYKTTEQHDLDLQAGRIDAIFAYNSAVGATFEKPDFKGYAIVGPKFSGGVLGAGVAVGMRKDEPELKKLFDDAIASVMADGTLKALSTKWFKSDISPQG